MILIGTLFIAFLCGFIEPLPVILKSSATRMKGWTELTVNATRTQIVPSRAEKEILPVKLTIKRAKGATLVVGEGKGKGEEIIPPASVMIELIRLAGDPKALLDYLKTFGVDETKVSLSHLNRVVCHVVGGREGEPMTSQYWIEKFSHYPARLIYTAIEAGQPHLYDIRMSGWDLPGGAGLFPQTVQIHHDGHLIEQWDVTHAEKK